MLTSTKVINDPSNEIDITDNNDDKKQEESESNEINITDNNDDKKHEESENGFHGFVVKAPTVIRNSNIFSSLTNESDACDLDNNGE